MQTISFKMVTIIADESLKTVLAEEIIGLGARGFTVTRVEGQGKNGSRDSAWSGENVKIETIVTPKTAEEILVHLSENYFQRYAVIAYAFDVQTIRSDHFV